LKRTGHRVGLRILAHLIRTDQSNQKNDRLAGQNRSLDPQSGIPDQRQISRGKLDCHQCL
jgi:hypothetical protein